MSASDCVTAFRYETAAVEASWPTRTAPYANRDAFQSAISAVAPALAALNARDIAFPEGVRLPGNLVTQVLGDDFPARLADALREGV